LTHKPDILVVPECEHISKFKFDTKTPEPSDMLWFGDNQNKGLGIFSYGNYKLKLRRNHNPELKLIIPVSVSNDEFNLTLFAIWANNPADPDGQYVEQVWKAIKHYNRYLTDQKTILIGDFNSNTIWDRKYREGNHSNVVKKLEKKGIISSYHFYHKQIQGKEQHPTFYLYKHKDKPYHLDYCFVSSDIAEKIEAVEIGEHEYWMKYSDHVPLSMTFRN
ncbi:MAG: endonuclease/exonuclease/phosphatase family protein, partial [Bacteroidetes bacterium]|nr:endonuclease/exonuclease/phosphatase family protein [Bacteroidota bacterium]